MKHQTISSVPIAVIHLSNTSNPTRNDNPNYPSPTFVVAQNSPRCTRLVLSLRLRIPLVVAQKSPCCGDLAKSGSGLPYPAARRGGNVCGAPCATCWRRADGWAGARPLCTPTPWPRHPGHPRHPGLRLLGAYARKSFASSQAISWPASLSLARKPTLPPSWVSWVS